MVHRYDDISFFVSFVDIPVSLSSLFQRKWFDPKSYLLLEEIWSFSSWFGQIENCSIIFKFLVLSNSMFWELRGSCFFGLYLLMQKGLREVRKSEEVDSPCFGCTDNLQFLLRVSLRTGPNSRRRKNSTRNDAIRTIDSSKRKDSYGSPWDNWR